MQHPVVLLREHNVNRRSCCFEQHNLLSRRDSKVTIACSCCCDAATNVYFYRGPMAIVSVSPALFLHHTIFEGLQWCTRDTMRCSQSRTANTGYNVISNIMHAKRGFGVMKRESTPIEVRGNTGG